MNIEILKKGIIDIETIKSLYGYIDEYERGIKDSINWDSDFDFTIDDTFRVYKA